MSVHGALRVVVYAEGGGEAPRVLVPPGGEIVEDDLGAAHVLVRRTVATARPLPEGAIRFVAPLRPRGRHANGSDLLDPVTLGQLLAWPRVSGDRAPHLAVVLLDLDGADDRALQREVVPTLALAPLVAVCGVARQEFEAWLLAGEREPELLAPGMAKGALARQQGASRGVEFRRGLAQGVDLGALRRRCPSYDRLARDIATAVNRVLAEP